MVKTLHVGYERYQPDGTGRDGMNPINYRGLKAIKFTMIFDHERHVNAGTLLYTWSPKGLDTTTLQTGRPVLDGLGTHGGTGIDL